MTDFWDIQYNQDPQGKKHKKEEQKSKKNI